MYDSRNKLRDKRRIVIKIGSSSMIHEETGALDFLKLEKLVRFICDLKNEGKDVILVSSGAIGVGAKTLGLSKKPQTTSLKQACAAIGQGQLMMIYQKLFLEYNQNSAQILLTLDVIASDQRRNHAINTLRELLQLEIVPVVNENDTVATEEIEFGDNDKLSALVCILADADFLVILSDIDGLYTDDPKKNPDAKFLHTVSAITEDVKEMAKGASSIFGTGGMETKISAAKMATKFGADVAIVNGKHIDVLYELFDGIEVGTMFLANKQKDFDIRKYVE